MARLNMGGLGRRGGLRPTALERRIGRYMRSEGGHEGDPPAGDPPAGDPPAGDPPAGDPPPSAWYGELSADARDNAPSDKDWMATKGFADPAAMVKSYRQLEQKLSGRNAIELPGEGATDEQRAAFHKAIGVPESVEGYDFKVPEGWEADMAILTPIAEAALKAGTPKAAFESTVGAFMDNVMAAHNARIDASKAERDATIAGWGDQADHNLELYRRGIEAAGWTAEMVTDFELARPGNTKALYALGLKMGQLSNEDGYVAGGKRDFGITGEQARIKLAELEKDAEFRTKLYAKDPAAIAERERLIAVISADDERKAREAQAA